MVVRQSARTKNAARVLSVLWFSGSTAKDAGAVGVDWGLLSVLTFVLFFAPIFLDSQPALGQIFFDPFPLRLVQVHVSCAAKAVSSRCSKACWAEETAGFKQASTVGR